MADDLAIPPAVDEPLFAHGQAVEASGVASETLQAWIKRGVVNVGTLSPTGRRLFSILDIACLRFIRDFGDRANVPPSSAVAVCPEVAKRLNELVQEEVFTWVWNGAAGAGFDPLEGSYLYAFFDGGRLRMNRFSHWERDIQKDIFTFEELGFVVPLDLTLFRVTERLREIFDRRNVKKKPVGPRPWDC